MLKFVNLSFAMHFCRICRTEKNLKYTTKELRQIFKKQRSERNERQKQILGTHTMGNICNECEERLHNFHNFDEDETIEVDCDGVGQNDVEEGCVNGQVYGNKSKQMPVIVDDDDLLYNLFFKKIEQHRQQAKNVVAAGIGAIVTPIEKSLVYNNYDNNEVIEVLTSRESTPVPVAKQESSKVNARPAQTLVAIIDLDDDDDEDENVNMKPTLSESSAAAAASITATSVVESDDDEIVFRNVDSPLLQEMPNPTCSNESYNLIARVSLLSSDEEDELESLHCHSTASNTYKCSHCNVFLPDAESLQVHERIHTGLSCPLCKLKCFVDSRRLVNHLRTKHRGIATNILTELPKNSRDTAMTIRLKYMDKFNYFECQLCGRLDTVFKQHNEHVFKQHEAECKSLKEPLFKQVKCTICQEDCGTSHLYLCQHALNKHTAVQIKTLFTEVTHASHFSWSKNLKHILKHVRVYQYVDITETKYCFFQCLLCKKVLRGNTNYTRHFECHLKDNSVPMMKEADKKQNPAKLESNKRKSKKSINQPITNKQKIKKITPSKRMRLNKKNLLGMCTKVKVKAPLIQLPTQMFKCKLCNINFKGFYALNLHLLSEHSKDEHFTCYYIHCRSVFTNKSSLWQHISDNHNQTAKVTYKCRRKYQQTPKTKTKQKLDENYNCKIVKHSNHRAALKVTQRNCNDDEENALWLQELLKIHHKKLMESNAIISNTT